MPSRTRVGEMMSHWHASMNDPIYAVGSFYVAGQRHPDVDTIRAARSRIVEDISKPCFQSPEDQGELRKIVAYLDKELNETSDLPESAVDLDFEDFVRGYLVAMLWSTNGDDPEEGMGAGAPLDDEYGVEDFAADAIQACREDCKVFYDAHKDAILEGPERSIECSAAEFAGHNFLLTRNGHGAGFGDGDYPDAIDKALYEAAGAFSEVNAYVGDDRHIHIE